MKKMLLGITLIAALISAWSLFAWYTSPVFGISKDNPLYTISQIRALEGPLNKYRYDLGTFPNADIGLSALIEAPKNSEESWKGPYVDEMFLYDQWGRKIQYRIMERDNQEVFVLFSFGPDGFESDDDIGKQDS